MRPQPAPKPPPAKAKSAAGPTDAQRRDTATVLLSLGASAFVVSYLGTAFAGAAAWDDARARRRESEHPERFRRTRNRDLVYGASLMVPVVGPFVGIGFSGSAARSLGLGISGALQAGSLLMAIAGARGLIRLRKGRKLTLSAKAGVTGAQASVAISF